MTTTISSADQSTQPTLKEQASLLLGHVAGYAGHRTIAIGLRQGLFEAMTATGNPVTSAELADRLDLDGTYVSVWCRAAFSAGVLERDGDGYRLGPHLDTLLLDPGSAGFVGGLFPLMLQPEMFDRFEQALASGERLWWDETSPDWIAGVAATGRPFYTRLLPGALEQVPGLAAQLTAGTRVVDTACGAGAGVVRLASLYPRCEVVGIDGDAHSLELAQRAVDEASVGDRVALVHSPLEEMRLAEPATVVINNISMHECRDIDRVTRRVLDMLEPGGWFVISDFPFPDTDAGLRSVPGRVMGAVQFFEAQIDDQLLPRSAYDDLLTRHGFTDLGSAQLTPMHALTWGRRPA